MTTPEYMLFKEIEQALMSLPPPGAFGFVMSTRRWYELRYASGIDVMRTKPESEMPWTYMGLPIRHSHDLPPPWREGTVTPLGREQFQRMGLLIDELGANFRRPRMAIWQDMMKVAEEATQ